MVTNGRSRKGAWIEIGEMVSMGWAAYCRSRKGAWIEISVGRAKVYSAICRSYEGAWIEISRNTACCGPVYCRSREGAWIEIMQDIKEGIRGVQVAPARERGLKWVSREICRVSLSSL